MSVSDYNARKAFQQGKDAYPNGECPYTKNARYRAAWFSGYNQEKFLCKETDHLLRQQTEWVIQCLQEQLKKSS